jgi:hypothetical protein
MGTTFARARLVVGTIGSTQPRSGGERSGDYQMATNTEEGRTVYVDRGSRGGGMAGIIIAIAVLAAVVIAGFYFMSASRNDAIRTDAVSTAASSVANSAEGAAKSVGDAADSAAGAVNPEK